MLLTLEVDHGRRQRVRQLATRLGEGERADQEADDRGSRLPRPRRGSPVRTVAAQTHKARTHRQRTLAASSPVCAPTPILAIDLDDTCAGGALDPERKGEGK